MESYASLLEMGFSREAIKFALGEGYTTISEIVDFLCQKPSNKHPSVLRLRTRENLMSSAIPFPVPLSSTAEPIDMLEANNVEGVLSNTLNRKRSFEEHQEEARKLATKLRKLKMEEIAEKERVKRQVEEDKAERALRAQIRGVPPTRKPLALCAVDGTYAKDQEIKIKVTLPSDWPSSSRPTVGQFNKLTSTQQDLENFVQSLIDDISTETHEHLTLNLPCIHLSTLDIPRRLLNNASSRTSLLSDLGLCHNTHIVLVHSSTECSQVQIPDNVSLLGSLPPSIPESPRGHPSSPPQQPSVPTNPDPSQIPPAYHPPGPPGAAAIFRALLPREHRPEQHRSKKICQIPSLRRSCFNTVVKNIEIVTKSGVRFDVHHILNSALCDGVSTFLRQLTSGKLVLPECLGVSIIDKLKKNHAVNAATLKLLRNFVCDLDLSCSVVTMEMVTQLILKWPALTKLNLADLQNDLQAETLENLGELKNLRYLNIKGQGSVDANVVKAIGALPALHFLKITNSLNSEGCWEELLSHRLSGNTSLSPLIYLSVDGFGFTDSSLHAIIQLFPYLRGLDFKNTEVTGCAPLHDRTAPLKEIRSIKVSRKLIELPPFLVPEVTSLGYGLEQIDVQDCRQLNVTLFLDRIEGQPLQNIYGMTHLGSITLEHVLRLSHMGFQLRQVDLCYTRLWKGVSMSLLSRVIEGFSSNNLFNLYLPRFTLQDMNDASIGEFMESLFKARSLKELDFGNQAQRLSVQQLSAIARGLPALERVIANNLTSDQAIALRNSLPRYCRLRIINEATFISPASNVFDDAVADL